MSEQAGVCWRGGGATGLLNKGGGSNRLPGLVTKQQAVEFPQVQTSTIIIILYIKTAIYSPVLHLTTLIRSRFQAGTNHWQGAVRTSHGHTPEL